MDTQEYVNERVQKFVSMDKFDARLLEKHIEKRVTELYEEAYRHWVFSMLPSEDTRSKEGFKHIPLYYETPNWI